MTKVAVPADFLTKVVGMCQATKGVLDKSAADKDTLRKTAVTAVAALVKRGMVEPHLANQIAEGFVAQPHLALEALQKLAEGKDKEPDADADDKAGKPKKGVMPPQFGGPDKAEKKASDAGVAVDPHAESNAVWEQGFGLR